LSIFRVEPTVNHEIFVIFPKNNCTPASWVVIASSLHFRKDHPAIRPNRSTLGTRKEGNTNRTLLELNPPEHHLLPATTTNHENLTPTRPSAFYYFESR
jgi:hypothetical protein